VSPTQANQSSCTAPARNTE